MTADNFPFKSLELLITIKSAVRNAISFVQIREKQLSARLLFELTENAVRITQNSNTKLLVNDRADVALAARADGVHLTSGSVSARTIRSVFPPGFVIGVSTHSIAEAEIAKADGADFIVFGPVFAVPGKSAPVGLGALRTVHDACAPMPVLGLGGIDETNYNEVLGVADGLAAIRFLNNGKNLRLVQNR